MDHASTWLLVAVIVLVLVPLMAAMAGQIAVGADYHPAGDLADIELHTRDIGHHPVELGQYSRGTWSHPGPALFYAVALPYRLSGSRSIGTNLGALWINGLSVAGILLLVHRRGGRAALWVTAVSLAVLLRGFGPGFLIEPWNPSVTVLPFGLFLFLVWELACGSAWAIPMAAVVGSFCVQTHVGYVPLVLPLLGLGVAWAGRSARAAVILPLIATVGLLSVLWRPPLVEEIRTDPGNLTSIVDYFRHSHEPRHSLGDGYADLAVQLSAAPEWVTGHLHLTPFTVEPDVATGAPIPVLALPVLAAAVFWWRQRRFTPLRLLAVAAASTALGVVAVAQVRGPLYHYRLGWTRVVAMATAVGAAWALWTAVVEREPRAERRVLVPLCAVALVLTAATGVPRFARADPPLAGFSHDLAALAPRLLAQLPLGDGAVIFRCDGDEGCIYLAGFVLWFERMGIDALVENPLGVVASGAPHRVFRGGPVRAVLHVSIDAPFFVRAQAPDTTVLASLGQAPTRERARLAAQILALDADYRAGRLGAKDHLFARTALSTKMGAGVGVLLEPLRA